MKKTKVNWTTGLYNFFYKEDNKINKIKRGKKVGDKGSYYKVGYQDEEGFTTFKRKQLNNYENLCFMNSSMQCLAHLVNFRNEILNLKNTSNLIKETQNLFKDMKNGEKYSNVSGIKNVLSEVNDRYKDNNQEDANEFISTFLDTILEDTKSSLDEKPKIDVNEDDIIEKKAYEKICRRFYQKKGGSFIVPLFYGLLKEEKICPKCNAKISVDFNSYNILELPINEFKNRHSVNLKDIINSFYGKAIEFIENECCPNCGEIEKVHIITTICTLPRYLIIHLRRTVNNRYIDLDIDYEDKIELSQNILNSTGNKCIFNLCGVIFFHCSSYYSKYNHYTASCLCDKDWYHFNDSYVEIDSHPASYKGEIILFYEQSL